MGPVPYWEGIKSHLRKACGMGDTVCLSSEEMMRHRKPTAGEWWGQESTFRACVLHECDILRPLSLSGLPCEF